MYSKPCQTSISECLTKKVTGFRHWLFLKNNLIILFDRILDMPLDHWNCFAMVLRGVHRKVDICHQTDYSIHSKQGIFPYSHATHWSTIFKLTKG